MKDAEKISCPCGKKLEKYEWDWLGRMYGEHPYCGCLPCYKCQTFSTLKNDIELDEVHDYEYGILFLCRKCVFARNKFLSELDE